MYSLINKKADFIVQEIGDKFVSEYEWLLYNLKKRDVSYSYEYRKRYSTFWRLSGAGLDSNFKKAYFKLLEANKSNPHLEFKEVCEHLYKIPANSKGTHKFHFSISTKLVHMINPEMPIYDKMVREFYFLPQIGSGKSLKIKILDSGSIYDFLKDEYTRILSKDLLNPAIRIFRSQLKPNIFTDEKIIDSLIWKFVSIAKKEGFLCGIFEHS